MNVARFGASEKPCVVVGFGVGVLRAVLEEDGF